MPPPRGLNACDKKAGLGVLPARDGRLRTGRRGIWSGVYRTIGGKRRQPSRRLILLSFSYNRRDGCMLAAHRVFLSSFSLVFGSTGECAHATVLLHIAGAQRAERTS